MITIDHIIWLLDLQKATNVAYFGEDWERKWTPVALNNSIYREWAEFLDEVSVDWKNYGTDQKHSREDAVYEMVDVAHFMLSGLLVGNGQALPIKMQLGMAESGGFNVGAKPDEGTLAKVTEAFTWYMSNPHIRSFSIFLARACLYLELDIDTYILAHKRKNDRNRLRAAGGAGYDKSKETPLTLEF